MSEILIGSNPDDVNATTTLPQTAEDKAKQLPEVSGYRILCAIPEADDKFDNGLAKSSETMRLEEVLSTVFFVVNLALIATKMLNVFQQVLGVKKVILF